MDAFPPSSAHPVAPAQTTSLTLAPPARGQVWNSANYAANGRFVADLASPVVDLLAPQPGEHILDLGCGDGALTGQLAATGAIVTGLDASAAMVAAARARGLEILHGRATDMHFVRPFDAIFSNAALHWIPAPDQPRALAAAFHTLKPGGRFVAEMGGQGNIAAIRAALSAVLLPHGLDAEAAAASFFPSPPQYRRLLEQAGFLVHSIALHPRPTPLPHGPDGLAIWLSTFRSGVSINSRRPPAIRPSRRSSLSSALSSPTRSETGPPTTSACAFTPPAPETSFPENSLPSRPEPEVAGGRMPRAVTLGIGRTSSTEGHQPSCSTPLSPRSSVPAMNAP